MSETIWGPQIQTRKSGEGSASQRKCNKLGHQGLTGFTLGAR